MKKRQFDDLLKVNRKEIDESLKKIEHHSVEFDKKMRKLLLTL